MRICISVGSPLLVSSGWAMREPNAEERAKCQFPRFFHFSPSEGNRNYFYDMLHSTLKTSGSWYIRLKTLAYILTPSLLIGYLIIQISNGLWVGQYPNDYFCSSEFLINYEGGFVRRGLLGQGLLLLCKHTGWAPVLVINIFCITVFAITLAFFFIQFHKKKLNWWILLCPLMFGLAIDIIRKDYLTYLIAIGMLYLVGKSPITHYRYISTIFLMVLGLFIHEAFIFYGIPLSLLIMWRRCNNRFLPVIAIVFAIGTFVLFSYYKGDYDTATQIIESWDKMGPSNTPLLTSRTNAVGAIGWSTMEALEKHLRANFVSWGYNLGRYGLIYQPLTLLIAYYFIMNFTPLFSNKKSSADYRIALSSVSIFSIICLLPMFIFLSCDYGRLYQYVFMMTYALFLIIPLPQILNLFPTKYIKFVNNFNMILNRIVPPSKGLMVLILLLFAVSPYSFDPLSALRTSVVFTDFNWIDSLLLNLK